ncbi:MAG TPA: ribose-phosphate diphosphokinase [Armatimonadota bacterium]|jgi:ribose-phosphate pyrophosphokinase
MILFHTPAYAPLAVPLQQRAAMTAGHWHAERFPNGEWQIHVEHDVRGEPCLVLAAISPPDSDLLTTLLLCHTLKKEGAAQVIAFFPYLAYMRQDKDEPGRSQATAWVGRLLGASGLDDMVTVDVHSARAGQLLTIPVRSLSPAPLWAAEIRRLGWQDATLVAPDGGAVSRCEDVRRAAAMSMPIAVFAKQRTPEGVRSTFQGSVGKRAVVVDDILDTGGTLLACCSGLLRAGAQEIIILVTHGLFTGVAWQRLWTLGVKGLYCTTTLPLPAQASSSPIKQISIFPLCEEFFRERRQPKKLF